MKGLARFNLCQELLLFFHLLVDQILVEYRLVTLVVGKLESLPAARDQKLLTPDLNDHPPLHTRVQTSMCHGLTAAARRASGVLAFGSRLFTFFCVTRLTQKQTVVLFVIKS